jgi:hypothetical protein
MIDPEKPVEDPEDFYGQKSVVRRIFSRIGAERPQSVGRWQKTRHDQLLQLPAKSRGKVPRAGTQDFFLLDDFHLITSNSSFPLEFYSFLRSLANNYPMAFITASGRNLKDMCVSHEIADSPFFNVFSVQHLGLFKRSSAEKLIAEPSAAESLERKGYIESADGGGFHPFSQEFRRFASRSWNLG